MDIVKLSMDWAKAEVFSAKIAWLFSAVEIVTAIGFWRLGKTAMAKAFVWPFLVAGLFLVAIVFKFRNERIISLTPTTQETIKHGSDGERIAIGDIQIEKTRVPSGRASWISIKSFLRLVFVF